VSTTEFLRGNVPINQMAEFMTEYFKIYKDITQEKLYKFYVDVWRPYQELKKSQSNSPKSEKATILPNIDYENYCKFKRENKTQEEIIELLKSNIVDKNIKPELKKYGLKTGGIKLELLTRLVEYYETNYNNTKPVTKPVAVADKEESEEDEDVNEDVDEDVDEEDDDFLSVIEESEEIKKFREESKTMNNYQLRKMCKAQNIVYDKSDDCESLIDHIINNMINNSDKL
jgi:hypothetical protein